MSKALIDINKCLNDLPENCLQTLRHAAQISPFVTERTIGPDKKRWDEVKQKNEPSCIAGCDDNIIKEKKTSKVFGSKALENTLQINSETSDFPKLKTLQALMQDIEKRKSKRTETLSNVPALQNLDYQTIQKTVLIREAEHQRKSTIRQRVIDIQIRDLTKTRHSIDHQRHIQEGRNKWLLEKRRSDSQILQQAEQQAVVYQHENQREIDNLHMQTKVQLQAFSDQIINHFQTIFHYKFEILENLVISIEKPGLIPCGDYHAKLKELLHSWNQLIPKFKAGGCEPAQIKIANNICKSLNDLEEEIVSKLEKIIQEEQEKAEAIKDEELQRQEKQREQAEAAAAKILEEAATPAVEPGNPVINTIIESSIPVTVSTAEILSSVTDSVVNDSSTIDSKLNDFVYVTEERFQFYTQINTFYQEKLEKVKPLQTDDSMKMFRISCQKAFSIPINAISFHSPQLIQDKFEKLFNIITGQPVKTATGQITVNDHPLGRDYCILLIAKKFVNQGSTEISSNPKQAFAVASVIVSLWKLIPDFGQLFLAYTFKESPFLVPYFIPKKADQTSEDGQLENQELYLKRQVGVARLYAAVMVTNGRQVDGPAHPYGIENGWRFLANFVRLNPLPEICATIMLEILQIISLDMYSAYGSQFVKMLFYIQQHYYPKLNAVDEGGPKARLEIFLNKFLTEGKMEKPQGMLPNGFW